MRIRGLGWIFAAALVAGCGHGTPGFVIDDVSLSPNDIPVDTTSNQLLKVQATVTDDLHDVTDVWANSDEASFWLDLAVNPFVNDQYSATIPLSVFRGYPVGDYYIDLHALDSAGRQVDLANAVRLRIRPN